MTQNNFTKGKYGREIRNSCNFSVLFRNCCDASINENVARMAGLSKAYAAAATHNLNVMYPYVFLDQSQQGQVSNYRLYTDIFAKYKVAWSLQGMKGYVIGASDFETFYSVFSNGKSFDAIVKNVQPAKTSPDGSNSTKIAIGKEKSDITTERRNKTSVEVSQSESEELNDQSDSELEPENNSKTENSRDNLEVRPCRDGSGHEASSLSRLKRRHAIRYHAKKRSGRTLFKN